MITNRRGTIYSGSDDPFILNQLIDLNRNLEAVKNAYVVRPGTNPGLFSRKDLNKECDYPETSEIRLLDYKYMYDRNPIGNRVVGVMPDECWQVIPNLYEDEDVNTETPFEKAFRGLGKTLQGEESWFDHHDQGSPLWEYLSRVDRISGIGHFGILLLGIDDGKQLDQPVDGFSDPSSNGKAGSPIFVNNLKGKPHNLIYMSVFDETCLQNVTYETTQTSPRYRKPKYYEIDLGEMLTYSGYVATGREGKTVKVHWSRVVHIVDHKDSSEIIGIPRQRPVWDNLLDLKKIYGGDAEGFWQNCVPRTYLETHPQMGGDVTVDIDSMKTQMWDMETGLRKWAALSGMSAKTVAPQVVDPTSHVRAQIECICIKLGIPLRIFMGSERGQLASSQDDNTWNDRLRGRRSNYLTPRVIVPTIDRLIQMRVLPVPKSYRVEWPDPETLKPLEKAELAVRKTSAIVQYIGGQGDSLIDPMDFLTRFLEIPEQDAQGMLERAMESQQERVGHEAELHDARVDAGLIPPVVDPTLEGAGGNSTTKPDLGIDNKSKKVAKKKGPAPVK